MYRNTYPSFLSFLIIFFPHFLLLINMISIIIIQLPMTVFAGFATTTNTIIIKTRNFNNNNNILFLTRTYYVDHHHTITKLARCNNLDHQLDRSMSPYLLRNRLYSNVETSFDDDDYNNNEFVKSILDDVVLNHINTSSSTNLTSNEFNLMNTTMPATITVIQVDDNKIKPSLFNHILSRIKNMTTLHEYDRLILQTSIPNMINLGVVPLINTIDTYWVSQVGLPLALAGQSCANQCFFTIFFLINYVPTISASYIASAIGSNNINLAQQTICQALFLCTIFGFIGTILLVLYPTIILRLVLPSNAPALYYAIPYLQARSISMIFTLFSATGFAAFRGSLDTITPLKVSLGTNLINCILDPILVLRTPLGVIGAAVATAISEISSGIFYISLLLKRKLIQYQLLLKFPSMKSLIPLLVGGITMLGRQLALNIGFLLANRKAQSFDPTYGTVAAAYGIVMQITSVTSVMHIAIQSTAATLVPAILAKSKDNNLEQGRYMANRIFFWGTLLGLIMGTIQYISMPFIIPLFTSIPEVTNIIYTPAMIGSLINIVNGPVFAGEGIMLGMRNYRDLLFITSIGISIMVIGLSSPILGQKSLNGIMISFLAFCTFQAIAVVIHYLKFSPLNVKISPEQK